MIADPISDIVDTRAAGETDQDRTVFLELLRDVTVAANESSTIDHAAQICLDRICSETAWCVGHVYLRENELQDLLVSTSVWHGGNSGPLAAFQHASDAGAHGVDLPCRVLHSRQAQSLLIGSGQRAIFPRATLAMEAGLQSAAAFPIPVGNVIMGVLELFSFQAIRPDSEFLALMAHTGSQLGQVISRQRTAEDLYRAKQVAESANRAKTEFLAVMSHEIRTPMNAILGMAEVLSETDLTPTQREYVRVFQGAGTKLLDLINSILDLSKVESGRFELAAVDFDLNAVLEKVLGLMAPVAHARSLQLTCTVVPNVRPALVGDPDRLRQILINLIGNAIKFTDHGNISVRVERDSSSQEGALRFKVTDTGIGIGPENRDMIFRSFTQVDSSTTRKYGGTGLGLAICKSLVELMGGHIWFTSEIGKGSTFTFSVQLSLQRGTTFPDSLAREKAGDLSASGASSSPLAGKGAAARILVAEDSEDNLFVIQSYLQDFGIHLEKVTNGKQALERIMSGEYDLVLMDLQMPVMDGHASTRAIRDWEKRTGSSPVPILLLTAHAFREVAKSSEEAGCTGHLTKPIKRRDLLKAISSHIHLSTPLAAPREMAASATAGRLQIGSTGRGENCQDLPPEIQRLVPGYLERRQQDLLSLRTAVEHADYDALSTLGHQLKGSGAAYGFEGLSDYGASLERAAATNDIKEARRQTALIARCIARLSESVGGDV